MTVDELLNILLNISGSYEILIAGPDGLELELTGNMRFGDSTLEMDVDYRGEV